MTSLIERATRLAVTAHEGQLRKEAPIPYITHPFQIALLLAKYDFSDTVIAAALVHDVVEDTTVTLDEVRKLLGEEVATIVEAVSNNDGLGWEDKKRAYIEAVRNGNDDAKAVATADKIHNADSLIAAHEEQGSEIWKHFNAGKEKKLWFERAMLTMLQESWKHPLVDLYAERVRQMEALD